MHEINVKSKKKIKLKEVDEIELSSSLDARGGGAAAEQWLAELRYTRGE